MKLLCVTAHPDDEAGSFGGTLRTYAERGVATYVICLTPGQAATHRGGARSDDELAEMRRQEFAASCKVLRVTRGEVLNYRDGALATVDFYSAVADLTQWIRVISPQVVITLGPEGGLTGHPDHAMAGMIATLAFQWAGRSDRFPEQFQDGKGTFRPQKLYYATANFTIPDRQPVSLALISAVIDITEYVETKVAAFKQHTSQAPLFSLFEGLVKPRGANEYFHLAASSTPRTAEHENDLFAGVTEN